ncbi:MAG: DUF484 family protein [Pseudomonadota bacterium]
MTTQQNRGIADDIDEKEVVEYLRSHPEFFVAHSHVLADMTVPHGSGAAVSLIERQVSVLRDQNRQLRRELMELVQIARENDRLNERLQRLTVALMEAGGLSEVFFTLHDALRNDFNADVLAIRLFVPPHVPVTDAGELVTDAFSDAKAEGLAAFKKILDAGKPVCGRLTPAQLNYLFLHRAGEIVSTALVPLSGKAEYKKADDCFGMIGIGSLDAERFHPAMGTLFLSYMGAIISRALMPYLKLS